MRKYVLMPGYVRSKNDDDLHYIGVAALAKLYRVRLSECAVVRDVIDARNLTGDEIWLRPRYDGQYHDYSNDSR